MSTVRGCFTSIEGKTYKNKISSITFGSGVNKYISASPSKKIRETDQTIASKGNRTKMTANFYMNIYSAKSGTSGLNNLSGNVTSGDSLCRGIKKAGGKYFGLKGNEKAWKGDNIPWIRTYDLQHPEGAYLSSYNVTAMPPFVLGNTNSNVKKYTGGNNSACKNAVNNAKANDSTPADIWTKCFQNGWSSKRCTKNSNKNGIKSLACKCSSKMSKDLGCTKGATVRQNFALEGRLLLNLYGEENKLDQKKNKKMVSDTAGNICRNVLPQKLLSNYVTGSFLSQCTKGSKGTDKTHTKLASNIKSLKRKHFSDIWGHINKDNLIQLKESKNKPDNICKKYYDEIKQMFEAYGAMTLNPAIAGTKSSSKMCSRISTYKHHSTPQTVGPSNSLFKGKKGQEILSAIISAKTGGICSVSRTCQGVNLGQSDPVSLDAGPSSKWGKYCTECTERTCKGANTFKPTKWDKTHENNSYTPTTYDWNNGYCGYKKGHNSSYYKPCTTKSFFTSSSSCESGKSPSFSSSSL